MLLEEDNGPERQELSFVQLRDIAARHIKKGIRPGLPCCVGRVTVRWKWPAAFDRAGFSAIDVHMSDILAGRRPEPRVQGAGGLQFSYGDVLGAR